MSGGSFETTVSGSFIMTVDISATAEIKNGTYIGADTEHVSDNPDAFAEGYAPHKDKDGNITCLLYTSSTPRLAGNRNV